MENSKISINRVPLGLIRTLEYPGLAHDILDIVEKHDVVAIKIHGVVNLYKESLLNVDKISVRERSHPVSLEIENLRNERDKFASAIVSHILGYKKAVAGLNQQAAQLAIPFLEKYFNGLYKMNNFAKSKIYNLMFTEIEGSSELSTALQTLGFMVVLDELKVKNLVLTSKMKERRLSKSETEKPMSKQAILGSAKSMRNLFKAIEINQMTEPDINYTPLIAELNETLIEYNSLLTQRKSLLTKEAIKKVTAPESVNTSEAANVNPKNSDKPSL